MTGPRAVLDGLRESRWEILAAGAWPGLLWLAIGGAVGAGLILALRQAGWLGQGPIRRRLTQILTADLALVALPLLALSAAADGSIHRATERTRDLLLAHGGAGRVGAFALLPALRAWRAGTGVELAPGPDGEPDLAVLTLQSAQSALGATLTSSVVEGAIADVRKRTRLPRIRLPAWMVIWALDRVHLELAASTDRFLDVASALRPEPDGVLPAPVAFRQAGERFLKAHAVPLADALSRRYVWIAHSAAFLQLLALAALCALVARRTDGRPRPKRSAVKERA